MMNEKQITLTELRELRDSLYHAYCITMNGVQMFNGFIFRTEKQNPCEGCHWKERWQKCSCCQRFGGKILLR